MKTLQAETQALTGRDLVIKKSEGGEKMSEVLEAFIEPYRAFADDYAAYNNLIMTAIIAWNAAITPDGQAAVDKIAQGIPEKQARADFRAIVTEMMERKRLLFSANKRLIINYKLTETKTQYHLSVASTSGDALTGSEK